MGAFLARAFPLFDFILGGGGEAVALVNESFRDQLGPWYGQIGVSDGFGTSAAQHRMYGGLCHSQAWRKCTIPDLQRSNFPKMYRTVPYA
jgi:hypothetical protein